MVEEICRNAIEWNRKHFAHQRKHWKKRQEGKENERKELDHEEGTVDWFVVVVLVYF